MSANELSAERLAEIRAWLSDPRPALTFSEECARDLLSHADALAAKLAAAETLISRFMEMQKETSDKLDKVAAGIAKLTEPTIGNETSGYQMDSSQVGDVQRYSYDGRRRPHEWTRDDEGEWIIYADHAAAVAKLRDQLNILAQERDALTRGTDAAYEEIAKLTQAERDGYRRGVKAAARIANDIESGRVTQSHPRTIETCIRALLDEAKP